MQHMQLRIITKTREEHKNMIQSETYTIDFFKNSLGLGLWLRSGQGLS